MHPTTKPIPAPLPVGQAATSSPPAGAGLLNGALAAVLGLGGLAVTVVLLWISTPYSGTPDDALHVAAALWLAGHGAHLVRTGTLSGAPMPVEVTPLLLTVCFGLLLWRAARHTADAYALAGRPPSALRVVGWTATGYLTVLTAALVYVGTGPLRTAVPSALIWPPLFVLAVLACAGRPLPVPGRAAEAPEGSTPTRSHPLLPTWFQVVAASRAAVLGVGTLLLGGLALTGTAVVWHAPQVWRTVPDLAAGWSGYVAVLLLTFVLLPNALIWSTAYALGPGFTVGGDSLVSPLATNHPQLPRFPLLAALPAEGTGTALTWSVGVLPAGAALLVGWYLARVAVPTGGRRETARGWADTLCGVGLAAVGCGAVLALLSEAAGGALGHHQLAGLGPRGWLVGAVACGWMLLLGAPAALTVRSWRLRDAREPSARKTSSGPREPREATPASGWPQPVTGGAAGVPDTGDELTLDDGGSAAGGPPGADGWPGNATRRARWAALKTASGGLMPDFKPADLPSPPYFDPYAADPYAADPYAVGSNFAEAREPEPGPEPAHDPEVDSR